MSSSIMHHLRTEDLPEVRDLSTDEKPLLVINSGSLSIMGTHELVAAWLANVTRQVLEVLP